jgi:hypothetical protein
LETGFVTFWKRWWEPDRERVSVKVSLAA